MNFNEAIQIIKQNKPNRLVWYGFEYKDIFVFAIAVDNKYIEDDGALSWYSVDKTTKNVDEFDYYGRVIFDGEYELGEASKSKMAVDITDEQLGEK